MLAKPIVESGTVSCKLLYWGSTQRGRLTRHRVEMMRAFEMQNNTASNKMM
jgi:hypothetical protein